MTATALIKQLQQFPGDAEVFPVYDCFCQIPIEKLWLSKEGTIIMAPDSELITEDDLLPIGESLDENGHWSVPQSAKESNE